MLPNHSPLVIAEQFGTLESLYPGAHRSRARPRPGTDQLTARALRRDPLARSQFPQDVQELQALFGRAQRATRQAVPGAGLGVPLWILGSSLFGAQLAALLGLPYAFASHFAPTDLLTALAVYRSEFRPSAQLDAVRDGRAERDRRRNRRGGAAPLHDAPASVPEPLRGRRARTSRRSTTSRRTGRRPRRRGAEDARVRSSGRVRPCARGSNGSSS